MKFVVNGEQNQHILSQRLVVIYGKGELEPLTHGEKGKHTYRNAEVRMTNGEIRLRNVDFFLPICQKTMLLVLLHAARCEFEFKSRM